MGRANHPVPGLGQRIYYWRFQRNLTLEDVAQRTGLNIGTLSRIENGETADPSFGIMLRIADALGVPLEAFAGRRTTHVVDHPPRQFVLTRQKTTERKRKAG